jgi:hypothetical protein
MVNVYTSNRNGGRSSHGSVVIECILVLPVILLILGYAVRITQMLNANAIAMEFSREVATEATRRCVDLTILDVNCLTQNTVCTDITATTQAINSCIADIKVRYLSLWSLVRPTSSANPLQASLDVEVYRYDLSSAATQATCGEQDLSTRFSTDPTIPAASISPLSMCIRDRISRSRVQFTLRPNITFLNLLPGVIPTEFQIVDETIQ